MTTGKDLESTILESVFYCSNQNEYVKDRKVHICFKVVSATGKVTKRHSLVSLSDDLRL